MIALFILGLVVSAYAADDLYCRDPNGNPVDWWIAYKIPKQQGAGSPMDTGHSFAYILGKPLKGSGKEQTSAWKLSDKLMTDKDNMFGQTLAPLYKDPKANSHVMYNDEPPHGEGKPSGSRAHAKGVVAMNAKSGFWLIHSIPAFAQVPKKGYEYPKSGTNNGQSSLCISFNPKDEAKDVTNQVRQNQPNTYSYMGTDEVLKLAPDFADLDPDSKLPKIAVDENVAEVTSVKGVSFTSFSRNKKSAMKDGDLYSAVVAPKLGTNMLVETWRRGAGGNLPSNCKSKFNVNNVSNMKIPFSKDSSKKDSGEWHYLKDHSKWGISDNSKKPFVCVGDVNRMESQAKRGGGTVCFKDSTIWQRFREAIVEIEACGLKKKSLEDRPYPIPVEAEE